MSDAPAHARMELAVDTRNTLGEGIVWCDRAQALYWTDISNATLWRYRPTDTALEHWTMPERLACFALCEDEGWLLLALASRLAFFRLADGYIETLHDVEPGLPTRSNDGACDRQGRFVFGTKHEPATGDCTNVGAFWRLNRDLSLERLALPEVAISNALAFSPDGSTMYFCDSLSRRIDCCRYGDTLGEPRVFVTLDDPTGEPDGACVDAQGNVWNAQWGSGRVVCYTPDAALRHVFTLPTRQPTRPALGGPRLDTLYVTTAREGLSSSALDGEPLAGAVFHANVAVPGLPEPRFAGRPGQRTATAA